MSGEKAVSVTMTLTSTDSDTNVVPTNTLPAYCGSPSPASQDITAGTPITFTWSCTMPTVSSITSVSLGAGASGAALRDEDHAAGGNDIDPAAWACAAGDLYLLILVQILHFRVAVSIEEMGRGG